MSYTGLSFEPIPSFRFGKCVHWLCMWVWYLCPMCKIRGCSHKEIAMWWILCWYNLNARMWKGPLCLFAAGPRFGPSEMCGDQRGTVVFDQMSSKSSKLRAFCVPIPLVISWATDPSCPGPVSLAMCVSSSVSVFWRERGGSHEPTCSVIFMGRSRS